VSPAKLFLRSFITSFRGLILPSAFVMLNPSFSIAPAASFGGSANLVKIERSAVPAFSPLIPAFAISPIASAVSSMLYPIAPATGATYWNVCPILDTLVFAFAEACAKTSAKCVESDAFRLKAVSASVTISDVVPRSSPLAAARFMIPSIPLIMSEAFHPAIAM